MNDERVDAAIRAAFEELEPSERVRDELVGPPKRITWRSEAIAVGLAAAAALALFIPLLLQVEMPAQTPEIAPAYAPPSGTRVVRLDLVGAQDGWPEAGASVDVYAAVPSEEGVEVTALLTEVPIVEDAHPGGVAVAVDPSLAVRAVHGGQTAALTLAVVLPDGRRVVELEESSPVQVGDRVDVIVTAPGEDGLETWTALRDAEVVYRGRRGPLVALSPTEAAEAVAVQYRGRIRLTRHLD